MTDSFKCVITQEMMSRMIVVVCSIALMLSVAVNSADQVTMHLVESIPQQTDKTLPIEGRSTFDTWMTIIQGAKETLHIGQYYWCLGVGADYQNYDGWEGAKVLDAIVAAKKRGVDVLVVRNTPGSETIGNDAEVMQAAGIPVTTINFTQLGLSGIFHTKMMVADGKNVYVGSANADWRSLSQVKEMGVAVFNSKELGEDAERIFRTVHDAAVHGSIPEKWPAEYSALYNDDAPLTIHDVNGVAGNDAQIYLAVSPDQFCASQRTTAMDSTRKLFTRAQSTIDIEVMDYLPCSCYMPTNMYWPDLDDLIRSAAYAGKQVRMLIGLWNYTKPAMAQYLASLDALDNIDVRWFKVPELEGMEPVEYTRVNHAKFFVTDSESYVSTNNWIADYFLSTHGINVIVKNEVLRQSLQTAFNRDWSSPYTKFLNETGPGHLFVTKEDEAQ